MMSEITLKVSSSEIIRKLGEAAKEFRTATNDDGLVDMDHVADVFSESDLDYNFVVDLMEEVLVLAGAVEKVGNDVRINNERLEAFLSSLKGA
jgi:hypothetical protein